MWSVQLIVGVALICAASALVLGVILIRRFEHRRHRELVNSHVSRQRGLSTCHRAQLSVDGNNYSQVPQPNSNLRRSTYLPYGLVSADWASVPSKEEIIPPEQIVAQPDYDSLPTKAKRRRSLRQTLYGHSFEVPKTRRQKKIEKAIPLNSVHRSPLSAITEFTDSTSEDQSPAIGILELPAEQMPKETSEDFMVDNLTKRPLSIQWPLPVAKRRTEARPMLHETSIAARRSTLLRMNGINHTAADARPSLGSRSLSMSSNISIAPDEPLPPLPPLKIRRGPQQSDELRLSATSVDSVGSSVLGNKLSSPPRRDKPPSAVSPETLQINLNSPGLQDFGYSTKDDELSVVSLGLPARQQGGYCRGQSAIGSFRASLGTQELLRNASTTRNTSQRNSKTGSLRNSGTLLETIDARPWDLAPYLEGGQRSRRLSPSLPAPVPRGGPSSGRHSMFEPQGSSRKWSTAKQGWEAESEKDDEDFAMMMPLRPASVTSSHPSEWNTRGTFLSRKLSLKEQSSGHKKGHKRQNCVRISNLPPPDSAKKTYRLPQMTEEEEEEPVTPSTDQVKIPRLTLLETGAPALRMRASLVDIKRSPSPFQNRPILEPTSRSQQANDHRMASYGSAGIPRPDSDVFSTSYSDPISSNIFAATASPRHWPLSPTPRHSIKLNSTPPAVREPYEFFERDSPILPSPIYTSAALFPRKSAVKGPRRFPTSGASSRTASPSPIGSKNANRRPGEDLRRSVMALRRMGSDGKLLDRNSRVYRNIDEDNASTFSISTNLHTPCESSTNLTSARFKATPNGTHLLPVHKDRTTKPGSTSFRVSRSKMSMALSPSTMSMGGASIWDDASVRGDSPEPELPNGGFPPTFRAVDSEDYENFVDRGRDENELKSEERLTSPQGRGIGLTVGNAVLGTPGSLYDGDGFLKDY